MEYYNIEYKQNRKLDDSSMFTKKINLKPLILLKTKFLPIQTENCKTNAVQNEIYFILIYLKITQIWSLF